MKSTLIAALFLGTGLLGANAASFPSACVEYDHKLHQLAGMMPDSAARMQQEIDKNRELFSTLDPHSQALAARALKSSCRRQAMLVDSLLERLRQENPDFHS